MPRELEEYREWEREQNSFFSNFKKTLQPVHIIFLVGLFLFGWYLIRSEQNPQWVIIAFIAVGIIIIWKTSRDSPRRPISERVIKILALSLMTQKIGTQYPNGTRIELANYCALKYQGYWGSDFKPMKWEVGFIITFPNKLKKEVLVSLHPYEGYITKILRKPEGYDGSSSKDIQVIMPTEFVVKEDKQKS